MTECPGDYMVNYPSKLSTQLTFTFIPLPNAVLVALALTISCTHKTSLTRSMRYVNRKQNIVSATFHNLSNLTICTPSKTLIWRVSRPGTWERAPLAVTPALAGHP